MTLELDWSERGGPPPRRGRRTGFGSRLIGMVIERQLGGAARPHVRRRKGSTRA